MPRKIVPLEKRLRMNGQRMFFKKVTYVYRENDYGEHFYYIYEGIVTISTTTANGSERLISLGKPGAFMGVQGMDGNKYYTNGIALTDCVLYQVSFEQFHRLTHENFELLDIITNSIRSY